MRERTIGFVYDCGMFESEKTTKKGNKERNCEKNTYNNENITSGHPLKTII